MTLEFRLKRSSTKSKRTHKKFPRYKLNNDYTSARNLKEWAYCKHNWNDDDYTYVNGSIRKFLMCNIGRPIDKVYSKFLKRCKNLRMYSPKEEFYMYIEKKEDIRDIDEGFYLTNGILNYKKPHKNIKDNSLKKSIQENIKRFKELNIHSKIKVLVELRVPQCLGKFTVRDFGEKTVYMDYYPKDYDIQRMMPHKFHNKECYILGIGKGINYDIINCQTGKTKFYYYINNITYNKSDLYFYYKE